MHRGETVLVVVVQVAELLSFIFYLVNIILSEPCGLVKVKPNLKHERVKIIPSVDLKALASLKGFIAYPPDLSDNRTDFGYISLEHLSTSIDESGSRLIIDAKCASLILKVFQRNEGQIEVVSLFLTLQHPTMGFSDCIIANPKMLYREGSHYRCNRSSSFNCYATRLRPPPDVLTILQLEHLEFEIGGDPSSVQNRKFSTPVQDC